MTGIPFLGYNTWISLPLPSFYVFSLYRKHLAFDQTRPIQVDLNVHGVDKRIRINGYPILRIGRSRQILQIQQGISQSKIWNAIS